MRKILLDPSVKVLQQSSFNDPGIYVIRGDHQINTQITLPQGSELLIEEGSISLVAPSEFGPIPPPYGIYLLGSNQEPQDTSKSPYGAYTTLGVTSKAYAAGFNRPSTGKHTVLYRQTSTIFMREGDYIKYIEPDNFEMKLTADCRVLLPSMPKKGNLYINSDKVNTIQIDGKCNFQLHVENCKLERIFACPDGMAFINRTFDTTETSRFDNCDIFAADFDSSLTPPDSQFLSIWAHCAGHPKDSKNTINRLIMHDCTVTNIGLSGTVLVDNCTFLFGPNLNNNYETIHCSNHSRITNCIFDGRENEKNIPKLNNDVIDTFNSHDVIIEGCTFKAYSSTGLNNCTIITVKSHYYNGEIPSTENGLMSNFLDAQNGVIIRNCYFDLPTFLDSGIMVWNGPVDTAEQDRRLNGQFILIEGNYIEMPKAAAFVNCLRYSDYTTVRNNVGCVNYRLVLVNGLTKDPTHPDLPDKDRPKNKAHNLVIEGNILRYQKYTIDQVPKGMAILHGCAIENLVLANNTVEGYVWNMQVTAYDGEISGTVRIENNESVGCELLKSYNDNVMPSNVQTFFSGNVSNGKKTDIGDYDMMTSKSDGLLFNGRQFFYTNLKKLGVYYDGFWYFADTKLTVLEKPNSDEDN